MRFLIGAMAIVGVLANSAAAQSLPDAAAIDAEVRAVMAETGARGLALAVIDEGRVVQADAWGERNAAGDPLTPDTIMYGASLTKAVFAYTVMQMVDEGLVDLDRSIAEDLDRPLPTYGDPQTIDAYADWTGLDERWRDLTPRILLSHSPGFLNFGFLEPDGRLAFHFDPGARYAYSGDGLITLQFVLEQDQDIDLGEEMRRRVFGPLQMDRTEMEWRPDFAANLADGWQEDGTVEPHDERSRPRAAGSMDTTISDFARFAAAFVSGEGLSPQARAELTRPQLPIMTRTQFPSLQPELPADQRRPDLAAGLGVIVFEGPQGPGFFKGGHNGSTANTWVCVERSQRCVVILSNDVRAERGFERLVRFIMGETGVPYDWEYGF